MNKIENRRIARNLLQRFRILRCAGFRIGVFDRHGMKILLRQRRVFEQALTQMREITIRITRWSYPLVNLKYMNLVPRQLFVG